MADSWRSARLDEVADINSETLNAATEKEYRFRYIDISSVTEGVVDWKTVGVERFETAPSRARRVVKPADVLLGTVRPALQSHAFANWLDCSDLICSTGFAVLRAKPELHPAYLFHLLMSGPIRSQLMSLETGTGYPAVAERDARRVNLLLPPLPEQRAIAAVLDAAGAAIEQTRAAAAAARRLKRGLVQALLTRGIDTAGKLRDSALHPDQFTATRLGLLPSCWNPSRVAAEFDIATGFTLNTDRRPRNKKRQYLRVANVQRAFIKLDDIAELEAEEAEFAARQLRLDDLLIVEGHADPMQIGRCARVPAGAVGMAFQNHLYRLRTRGVLPAFADLWLNSERVRRYWQSRCATSSGLNTINQRMLRAVPIPVPPPDEQKRIAELSEAADASIAAIERTVAAHERLKRGLMQVLLTGKVGVLIDGNP